METALKVPLSPVLWPLYCLFLSGAALAAQTESPPPATTPTQQSAPVSPAPETGPAPTHGTVLFQSHGEPPPSADEPLDPDRKLLPVPAQPPIQTSGQPGAEPTQSPELSDRERGALLFTAYDLDLRLVPATAGLTARAQVTVRNTGDTPLRYIALQVSSTLTWESVSLITPAGAQKLPLAQHLIDTDADHTGKASEAVMELPRPLLPGAALALDAFYAGTVPADAERLTRIGASEAQAAAADWDSVGPGKLGGSTKLRGFGNVLWYPVSAPQLFLGEGTRLFDAVDQSRLAEQAASIRLRLSVQYAGDAPTAAYFCGRRVVFTAVSDTPDAPTASSSGIATADFAAEPLGFRIPSLFLAERPEVLAAPLAGELAGGQPMLAVEADPAQPNNADGLAAATERLVPLLQQWLGARPLSALTVIDLASAAGPSPQPFQDGPLLLAPAASLTTSEAEPALLFSLTHAWVQTGQPWVDEGLAQFFALLEIEQEHGRDAMVAQLAQLLQPLRPDPTAAATAQSPTSSQPLSQTLIAAASELIFRRKAAAVWVMLREIVGAQALQVTLGAWRLREPTPATTARQEALALEGMLEKNSGKDLHRFFDDWVLEDRGLPQLTVAEVTPRPLPTTEKGHPGGWLTAVTVTNTGAAMADVPVIVSSGSFSTTVRLVIPAAGVTGPGTATARVQTESAPTEVQVNDGTTPELRTSVHRREVRSR